MMLSLDFSMTYENINIINIFYYYYKNIYEIILEYTNYFINVIKYLKYIRIIN
jgi:hypothetical protein